MPHFPIELKASEKYCLIFNSCTDVTLNCWPAEKDQLASLDTHLARSTLAMFRTELVTFCDQQTGWPQKPKIFVDFRVRNQIYKDNFHSWEFKHFNDSEVGATAAVLWKTRYIPPPNVLQALICGFGTLKKSTARFAEGQIWAHPSAWAAPGRSELRAEPTLPAVGARALPQGGGSWGSKFPLSDIWRPCVHFSAFVAVPRGAAWLQLSVPGSWVPTLAAVPWALGVLGHPSSPSSLQSSLWSPFPVEPASLSVSNNWQTRVAVPSSVGLWARSDIYSGFSFSSFPRFPKEKDHKKDGRFCYWVLPLFMYLQGKQRKCLLTPGKTNYFKMKGVYC